jgi:hypothetical protein
VSGTEPSFPPVTDATRVSFSHLRRRYMILTGIRGHRRHGTRNGQRVPVVDGNYAPTPRAHRLISRAE